MLNTQIPTTPDHATHFADDEIISVQWRERRRRSWMPVERFGHARTG